MSQNTINSFPENGNFDKDGGKEEIRELISCTGSASYDIISNSVRRYDSFNDYIMQNSEVLMEWIEVARSRCFDTSKHGPGINYLQPKIFRIACRKDGSGYCYYINDLRGISRFPIPSDEVVIECDQNIHTEGRKYANPFALEKLMFKEGYLNHNLIPPPPVPLNGRRLGTTDLEHIEKTILRTVKYFYEANRQKAA